MRLSDRKKLRPYQTLCELARDLNISVPALKVKLSELLSNGELSLETRELSLEEIHDETFHEFHDAGCCLVCGTELQDTGGNQGAGWGEFRRCPACEFSAHEKADFATQRSTALEILERLHLQSATLQRVLSLRMNHRSHPD